jgi:ribonuclease P protein component
LRLTYNKLTATELVEVGVKIEFKFQIIIFAFMDQTFGKKYKLCRQKLIDSVFKQGASVKQYPFVLHFLEVEETLEAPFQITISAPKRLFRKAHDRNRIKRLMRETVRRNKLILETHVETHKNLALFMVYTNKEEMPYDVLLRKTEQLFIQLIKKLEENDTSKIEQ